MKPISEAHVIVSGRVQGVFFRASTRDFASRCGVRGFVRNLPGGQVEAGLPGGRGGSSGTSPWTGATPSNRTRGSVSVTDLHSAVHWRPEGGAVRCGLCPHLCLIHEGKRGICKVRENRGGRLFALTYGKVSAVQFDPAEKKPRYHFHPGRPILSIGSVGCNFHCGFCQNYHLVECSVPLSPVPIPDLVRAARREGAVGISYTYNEPLIGFE